MCQECECEESERLESSLSPCILSWISFSFDQSRTVEVFEMKQIFSKPCPSLFQAVSPYPTEFSEPTTPSDKSSSRYAVPALTIADPLGRAGRPLPTAFASDAILPATPPLPIFASVPGMNSHT